ncbi:type I restriction-modification system subunit S [Campylobacter hyointestinalis]|uniref:restriction endonuclease subunit S n=1 Tax=Campylobacter hyointestinalis TaxID=198 RepID=UPI000724BB09|nr:restriction endonuclease subunit S [Campylobacter hyointestinalis]PPB56610.1 type I restriction endonuclease [Campylobacter hyointestinalis subsp. hyointestinalis]CUU70933.1 type I restriction-modification system subunit S [Campylobacter hyointestinalis]
MKSPKINFKEFQNEWDSTTLGDISKRIVRKNSNNETSLPLTISSQFGLIDQKNFFNHQVASKNLSNYYLLYKNEFAYNKSYSIGYNFGSIKRLKFYDKGALSTLYICFSFDKKFNTEFFEYYFDSLKWYKNIRNICAEGARNHGLLNVLSNDFFTIKINFPTDLKEQEAIGEFFKKIDEILDLEKLRFKKFENFKKTMLDKLFVASGENTPRLRLGSFTSNWTSTTLGELGEIITGSTPSTEKQENYSQNGMLWVTPSDIKGIVTKNTAKKLSKIGIKKARVVPKNSILVTCIASIGKNTLVKEPCSFNQQINALVPDKKFHTYFLLTLSSFWSKYMLDKMVGGMMPIVNKQEFSMIKTKIPTDPKEQEAIGEFFKNIDKFLEFAQNRILKLENIKKYLLNKMFV